MGRHAPLHRETRNERLWVIDDALPAPDCAKLIARARRTGWHNDTSEISFPLPRVEPRVTCRVEGPDLERPPFATLEDARLALMLFYRVQHALPTAIGEAQLAGLRPSMRCVRYHPGEGTDLHEDAARHDGAGAVSRLTLLLYLNDNFEGGETMFPELGRRIEPAAGRALVFEHGLLHRGLAVEGGDKYVLRAEVFYDESWAPERLA